MRILPEKRLEYDSLFEQIVDSLDDIVEISVELLDKHPSCVYYSYIGMNYKIYCAKALIRSVFFNATHFDVNC